MNGIRVRLLYKPCANILTPPDAMQGNAEVQVTVGGTKSNLVTVQAQPQSLSLFEFVSPSGSAYVYGRHAADGTLIGPTSQFPPLTTPVKPGETIYIAANGFGLTDTPVVSGAMTQSGNLRRPLPAVRIGGMQASVSFA